MIPLSSLNSAIYLNWTIEFFHVTHITFAQIALLRLVGIAWHSKKLFLHHTQKERRLSHYYWFSIIAKSKGTEDECKHHSYSRNDFHFWTAWWIESRWTMTAASSLFCKTWFGVKPLSFGTVIKARNWKIDSNVGFRGPIVYWILWGRIQWNWLNERS